MVVDCCQIFGGNPLLSRKKLPVEDYCYQQFGSNPLPSLAERLAEPNRAPCHHYLEYCPCALADFKPRLSSGYDGYDWYLPRGTTGTTGTEFKVFFTQVQWTMPRGLAVCRPIFTENRWNGLLTVKHLDTANFIFSRQCLSGKFFKQFWEVVGISKSPLISGWIHDLDALNLNMWRKNEHIVHADKDLSEIH